MSSATADEYTVFGTLDTTPASIQGLDRSGGVVPIATYTTKDGLTHSPNIKPIESGQGSSIAALPTYGTLDRTPGSSLGNPQNGTQWPSYFDFFYNRIHLIPNGNVNLGVVSGTRTTDVAIWNAYTGLDVTITDLPLTGSTSTSKSGEPSLPHVMAALTTVDIDLITAAAAADFSFTTTLTVVESTGQSPFLTISGLASLVLGIKPERPMQTSLEWATNIMTSSNGKEQRQSLRSLPRESRRLQYRPLTVADRNLLRNQLMSHHNKAFGVPVWMEAKPLDLDAAASDVTLFLDTSYARFSFDEPVMIWTSDGGHVVNQIDTVQADRLTLVRPLGADFSAGSMVIPMITGQVLGQVTAQNTSPQFEHPEFTLTHVDQLPMPDYVPSATHNGEPVFFIRPNANSPLGLNQSIDDRTLDYGLGTFSRSPEWISPKDVREHRFILRTQKELWDFRTFLFWLKGRGQSFYMPTFQDDLVQTVATASSDTAIDVQNTGYAQLVYQNTERWRDLAFLLPDGTYQTRSVTGSTTLDDGNDRIQINLPLGVGYNPGDLQISFLRRVRLSADRVEIVHEREDRTVVSLLLAAVDE